MKSTRPKILTPFQHLILISILLVYAHSQSCLNAAGEPVSWWVILKVPPVIKNSGYAYYDSNTRSGEFIIVSKTVDLDVSPLTQTLAVLSSDKI
jgi:hypothetical protein